MILKRPYTPQETENLPERPAQVCDWQFAEYLQFGNQIQAGTEPLSLPLVPGLESRWIYLRGRYWGDYFPNLIEARMNFYLENTRVGSLPCISPPFNGIDNMESQHGYWWYPDFRRQISPAGFGHYDCAQLQINASGNNTSIIPFLQSLNDINAALIYPSHTIWLAMETLGFNYSGGTAYQIPMRPFSVSGKFDRCTFHIDYSQCDNMYLALGILSTQHAEEALLSNGLI